MRSWSPARRGAASACSPGKRRGESGEGCERQALRWPSCLRAGEGDPEREVRGLELPVCKGKVARRVPGRRARLECSPGWRHPQRPLHLYSETPGGQTAVGLESGDMKGHHPPPLVPPLPLPQCLGI